MINKVEKKLQRLKSSQGADIQCYDSSAESSESEKEEEKEAL